MNRNRTALGIACVLVGMILPACGSHTGMRATGRDAGVGGFSGPNPDAAATVRGGSAGSATAGGGATGTASGGSATTPGGTPVAGSRSAGQTAASTQGGAGSTGVSTTASGGIPTTGGTSAGQAAASTGGAGSTGSTSLVPVPGTFRKTGGMASPRMGFTATLLPNGKVLVSGGIGSSGGLLDTAEVYDPASERFVAVAAPMTSARWLHCAVGLPDGKVLLAGGRQPGASIEAPEVALASAEIYDSTSGTFTATGSMSSGRHSPMVVLLPNKKVLVTGGRADLRDLVTAELYDPNSGRFASAGKQTRIQSAAVLLLDGNVLLAGGNGPAEIYNSSTASFSDTSAMGTARQNFGAVLLKSGKALFVGGVDATVGPSVYLASALLYDQGAGTFASTGSMRTVRSQFSATVLKSGKVLVAGGLGNASASESAEIYDPETGAFTATAHLTTGRNNHTATLLLDGRVLLLGGSSDAANAELFEP